jgi:hypothetical protein
VLQASLRAFVRPFIALASLFSCIGQPQLSAHSAALWASPAVVSQNSSVALSAKMSDSFQLDCGLRSGSRLSIRTCIHRTRGFDILCTKLHSVLQANQIRNRKWDVC